MLAKKIVKMLLPNSFQEFLRIHLDRYSKISYSQEGEDLILNRIFERKNRGFYVDVGAHHPIRFSNTYLFYKKGWRGINIEPNPVNIKLFQRYRPNDINIQAAVGKKGVLKYYIFDEPALNTFDEYLAKEREKAGYRVVSTINIELIPLSEILKVYLPKNTKIDFMNIDCEGYDFEVLQTNDWETYRPIILLIEVIPSHNIEDLFNHPIHKYLCEKDYLLFAKCYNTCIYVEKTHLGEVISGGIK